MAQKVGTVASVAPNPRKQPLKPSFRNTSCKALYIPLFLLVRVAAAAEAPWLVVVVVVAAPMTCIRVRTRSRGAHTMLAIPPDPAPATMEERLFWNLSDFCVV